MYQSGRVPVANSPIIHIIYKIPHIFPIYYQHSLVSVPVLSPCIYINCPMDTGHQYQSTEGHTISIVGSFNQHPIN